MRRLVIGLGFVALTIAAAIYAFSPRSTPPLQDTRIPVDRMRIQSLASTGDALVAGGELGILLRSTDDGASWQPAKVEPHRYATITAIRFSDARHGMALAHEGQILRTTDGGRSWRELRFDE